MERVQNIDVFFKKSIKSKKLLISMSTHNQESFMGFKTLINNQPPDVDLLFINDKMNSYYLRDNYGDNYKNILSDYVVSYNSHDITFFGSSMSGFASIFFASVFNANFIVNNPQVNLDVTIQNGWSDLIKNIKNIKNRLNLEDFIPTTKNDLCGYIVHGQCKLDILNINILVNSKSISKKKLIIETVNDDSHGFYINDLSKVFAINDIVISLRHLESMRLNNISTRLIKKQMTGVII